MRTWLLFVVLFILTLSACKKDTDPLVRQMGIFTDTLEVIHRDSIADPHVGVWTPLVVYGDYVYSIAGHYGSSQINVFQKRNRISGVVVDELELGQLYLRPKSGILENGKFFIFGDEQSYVIDLDQFELEVITSREHFWFGKGHAAVGDLYIYFGANNPLPNPGKAVYTYNVATEVETYLFTVEDPEYDEPSDYTEIYDMTAWRSQSGELYVAVLVRFDLSPYQNELWIYNADLDSVEHKLNLNGLPDNLFGQFYDNKPIYYDDNFDQLYILTERLNAINPYTGEMKWTNDIESESWRSQITMGGSGVYWLDDEYLNYVNGADGTTLFSKEASGQSVARLNIQQNVIPIGNFQALLLFDKQSGDLLYRAVDDMEMSLYRSYNSPFIDWENRRIYYYSGSNFVCARIPEHWE